MLVLMMSALMAFEQPVATDPIGDWVDRAAAAGYRLSQTPPMNSRNVALVAIAMFESINAITPRYAPYRALPTAKPGTAPEVAAAAAAHYLLVRLYPDQAASFDAPYREALAAVPDGAPKTDGIELGERVAAALLDARKDDGSNAGNTYRPFTAPGTYVPTTMPMGTQWAGSKPLALKSGDQFRPAKPYTLSSAQWAADYNEVKRLGAKEGSQRTPEQTEIARFWEFVGPGTYVPVARAVSAAKDLGLLERARVYALTTITASDALVAVLDAKYTYAFWRPITAIRNGDLDSNSATERDPAWEPLIQTPMHPEYPCAHCITQSGVATVLASVAGDSVPFSLTSPTAPGVTRRYACLSDYAAEVLEARIYDGVHYRQSGNVGAAMGRQIGTYIAEHTLRPR